MKRHVLVGLLLVVLAPLAAWAQSTVVLEDKVQDIVAWVNDDIILYSDLQETEQMAIKQAMDQGGSDLAGQVQEVKKQVLLRMIWDRLMVQEAERLFDMKSIEQDLLDRFMKSRDIESIEELDKMLEQYFITRDELLDRLVSSAAPDFVLDQQVRSTLSVSEHEAREYYQKHLDLFTAKGQVTFREIVLDDTQGSRQQQAEEVARRAREGEDFEKLVAEFSDSPSKAIGGKIGPMDPADLVPEVAEAVLGAEVGGIAGPFRTERGWHIVEVEQRVDASVTPYEQARRNCEEACRNAKFEPAFKDFIQRLWDTATIEVRKEYVDRIPDPWRQSVVVR